jgi:hypothetical protein
MRKREGTIVVWGGAMLEAVPDERLLNKIRKVRLLILDVDGVMTDGRIIIDDAGLESKQFDVRDGHGLKLLMRCDIGVVLLTGRRSRVVEHRAADLGITGVYQGVWNKAEAFCRIRSDTSLLRQRRPMSAMSRRYPASQTGRFFGRRGGCRTGGPEGRRLRDETPRRAGCGP